MSIRSAGYLVMFLIYFSLTVVLSHPISVYDYTYEPTEISQSDKLKFQTMEETAMNSWKPREVFEFDEKLDAEDFDDSDFYDDEGDYSDEELEYY
ncbi:hypothetical protein K7432_003718 [Basidiobolus ranarum]|uniref:Uncharacterized protein n=1 Tax=Basidiobolus ranarum TaxID=34480 RepID=A0ABR2W5U0_9FUNG